MDAICMGAAGYATAAGLSKAQACAQMATLSVQALYDKLEQFYHSPVTTASADVDSSASAVNLCPTTCAAEGVPCLR